MTEDLRSLIAETKRLDGEATPGPWGYGPGDLHKGPVYAYVVGSHSELSRFSGQYFGTFHNGINAHVTTIYRSAAPKLAAALEEKMDELRSINLILNDRNDRLFIAQEENRILREALQKAEQFCTWLGEDSEKFYGTDAGLAARSARIDIRKTLDTIDRKREAKRE